MPSAATNLDALQALDTELARTLATQPDLWNVLKIRFRDAVPVSLTDTPPDGVYLDGAPLTLLISQRIAQTNPPPLQSSSGQRTTFEGLQPLDDTERQAAERFVMQFSANAWPLLRDYAKRFWELHLIDQRPARTWVADWLMRQWQTQLQLRETDATLDPSALRLCKSLLLDSPAPWNALLTAVCAGRTLVLPGAFVVASRDPLLHTEEQVVLSTLTWGIERFASWSSLYQELAERLEDDIQGPALLSACAPEEAAVAWRCEALRPAPVAAGLFEHVVDSLRQRQRQAAWQAFEHARTFFAEGDFFAANQRINDASVLTNLLESTHLRKTHYVALLEKRMPSWLKALNEDEMVQLNLAMNHLRLATTAAMAPALPNIRDYGSTKQLKAFAHQQLSRGLLEMGIELSPDRIFITTVGARPKGPLVSPVSPTASSYVPGRLLDRTGTTVELVPHTRTLVQLALENVNPLDGDFWITALLRDERGAPIKGLDKRKVLGLVRRVDVGGRYGQFLLTRLRDSDEARWRRSTYRELLKAKMHYEGLKAAYRGNTGSTRTLHPWIRALLDFPLARDRRADGWQTIHVWQLVLQNSPIHGVYLIGPRPYEDRHAVLLHAPDNPAGTYWSLFESRQALTRNWLSRDDVRRYLVRRSAISDHLNLRQLISSEHGLNSFTREQRIDGDFFDSVYRSETRMAIANADALSVSNEEVGREVATEVTITILELISALLPGKIAGPVSLGRATWAAVRFMQAVQNDEPVENQLMLVVDMHTHLLEASIELSSNPLFSKVIRRLPLGAQRPLHSHMAVSNDSPYLKYKLENESQASVYESKPVAGGVSEYYIEDAAGRRYEVLFDGQHWRVVDARKPDALYKPIIQRNASGEWEMVDLALWRGPLPHIPALLERARLVSPPQVPDGKITQIAGRYYLRLTNAVVEVRPSLLEGRYSVIVPVEKQSEAPMTIVLRTQPEGSKWQAKVRQNTMSTRWFDLP